MKIPAEVIAQFLMMIEFKQGKYNKIGDISTKYLNIEIHDFCRKERLCSDFYSITLDGSEITMVDLTERGREYLKKALEISKHPEYKRTHNYF